MHFSILKTHVAWSVITHPLFINRCGSCPRPACPSSCRMRCRWKPKGKQGLNSSCVSFQNSSSLKGFSVSRWVLDWDFFVTSVSVSPITTQTSKYSGSATESVLARSNLPLHHTPQFESLQFIAIIRFACRPPSLTTALPSPRHPCPPLPALQPPQPAAPYLIRVEKIGSRNCEKAFISSRVGTLRKSNFEILKGQLFLFTTEPIYFVKAPCTF